MIRAIFSLIFLVFICENAVACYALPMELARPASTLVSDAKQIVWARVMGAEYQADITEKLLDGFFHFKYRLETIETLKGNKEKYIYVDGVATGNPENQNSNTLNNHTNFANIGQSGISGSCERVPPYFVIGARYLVFLGGAPDTKDFERVEVESDEWLSTVRKVLSGMSKTE